MVFHGAASRGIVAIMTDADLFLVLQDLRKTMIDQRIVCAGPRSGKSARLRALRDLIRHRAS